MQGLFRSFFTVSFYTFLSRIFGFVRDILLNRKQNKTDNDFVCVGSGIDLAKQV